MDMNQYLEVFIDESKEHLQSLNENLLELEKSPHDLTIVNNIFRAAHTLKGMAASMGYSDLANLTHIMENVLDGIRNEKINVSTHILDVIFQAVDDLEVMVESIEDGQDGTHDVTIVIQKLEAIEKGVSIDVLEAEQEIAATLATTQKLNQQYNQYELELLEQSHKQGFEAYELKITLRSDCALKAVRVYMIFEVLENVGEVIKTTPTVELLQEEQFDNQFLVTIITKEPIEEIQEQIENISEIEAVETLFVNDQLSEESETINKETTRTEGTNTSKDYKEEHDQNKPKQKDKNKTIRVNIERLDTLMNLFEELIIDRGRLEQISKDIQNNELAETVERMTRVSGDLQNIILNMRMVPIETVFNRFPRMVRKLSRELGKEIDLEILGADTELDRTVIDEIGDPIVHLLRNAIDHGIENPSDREINGKSKVGRVVLQAYHSGNHVFIDIEDDGAGINRSKIINKAIEKGIISQSEGANLSDTDAFALIMEPGFSTAEVISDVSGRGVGLDVVKSTINSIGGSISIESAIGKGTRFSIQLPLTLSIISAMLVEVGHEKYAIPLSSIMETAIIKKTDILTAHNQHVVDLRGKLVPLVYLTSIFNIETDRQDEFYSIVYVRKGEKMTALVVDSFIGQQEIVLKSLGNYLTDVFAISGATILGDGSVALIIDSNALIK